MINGQDLKNMTLEVREFAVSKGWRIEGDHTLPDKLGRTFGDEIALLHSELSEALEAFRDYGLLSYSSISPGEYGKPEGVGSELADVLIRLLECACHLEIDLYTEYQQKMEYNRTRPMRHGGKAL